MKQLTRYPFIIACLFLTFNLSACSQKEIQTGLEAEGTLSSLPSEEAGETLSGDTSSQEPSSDDEAPEPSTYGPDSMIPCTNGLFVYYNQADPRWGDELYGDTDFMKTHGCGPTAVAMIAASFTTHQVTPLDVALWASDNGYCSKGEGSLHSLIPNGLEHFGLQVKPLTDRSTDAIKEEIQSGNVIIALMNRGYFTNGGHFLLLTQVTSDGQLRIADPASWENSQQTWDPEYILSQVRDKADAGGPLWVVSLPPED